MKVTITIEKLEEVAIGKEQLKQVTLSLHDYGKKRVILVLEDREYTLSRKELKRLLKAI